MLDTRYDLFLIHIPKTGGTAIEAALGFADTAKTPCRHFSYRDFPGDRQSASFKPPAHIFAIRRNTFDRIQSTYRHVLRTKAIFTGLTAETFPFEDYVSVIERYFSNDNVEIAKSRIGGRGDYVYLKEDDAVPRASVRHIETTQGVADKCTFLDYDDLEDAYRRHVAPLTGITSLKKVNITPPKFVGAPADYTPALISRVHALYREEVDAFGMTMPEC